MKLRVLGILISIHLLILLTDSTGVFNRLRNSIEIALLPIQVLSRNTFQSLERSFAFISTFDDVYEQNAQLLQKNKELTELASSITPLQKENEQLRRQLDSPITQTAETRVGKVVSFQRENDTLRFIASIGENQGVAVDDAVIVGQTLVGKVVSVTSNRAVILPTIATQSVVPVYVQDQSGTKVNGVVHGEYNSGLVLSQFVREKTLEKDEFVFTSGLDGSYPTGLLVGKVTQVTSLKANVFQEALLQPLWDIAQLDTVFIVKIGVED